MKKRAEVLFSNIQNCPDNKQKIFLTMTADSLVKKANMLRVKEMDL